MLYFGKGYDYPEQGWISIVDFRQRMVYSKTLASGGGGARPPWLVAIGLKWILVLNWQHWSIVMCRYVCSEVVRKFPEQRSFRTPDIYQRTSARRRTPRSHDFDQHKMEQNPREWHHTSHRRIVKQMLSPTNLPKPTLWTLQSNYSLSLVQGWDTNHGL